MSKEEKLKQAITHKIFKDYGKIISPQDLDSVFKTKILSDEDEYLIDKLEPYFDQFEKTVHYIDNIRNPYGIYNYVREYAQANGNYYDKYGNIISINDLNNPNTQAEAQFKVDHYKPNNPNEYVIVITDHVSLLTPEKTDTLHQSMSRFSSNYSLKMRDRWGYTVVNIQQQSAEQEKQQFTSGGKSIIDKLRPSPDGLGDNKLLGRD